MGSGRVETRTFRVVGTGWDMEEPVGKYCWTWITPDGYVWHYFEL